METRFNAIPVEANLAAAIETLLATAQHEFPVIDAFGKPVGLLVREDLLSALKDHDRKASITLLCARPSKLCDATEGDNKSLQSRESGNVETSYNRHLGIRPRMRHGRSRLRADDAASQSTQHPLHPARRGGQLRCRIERPSTFYGGSDERGYPSGEPANRRLNLFRPGPRHRRLRTMP
jgi:hypothetical protein